MRLQADVEWNRYAQRAMDERLKPIDTMLAEWGKEAKDDGAPRWSPMTILGRVIEQGLTGASQAGAMPTSDAPLDVQRIDWCVAHLLPLHKQVVYVDYVWMPGRTKAQKARFLEISESNFTTRLRSAREAVLTLYQTIA